MNAATAYALEYHTAGMNVIPLHRYDAINQKGEPLGKKPLPGNGWKRWQRKHQTPADVEQLFANHDGNMAVIGGREIEGRGYLHWAEFDDRGRWQEVAAELAHSGIETWQTESKRAGHIWATAARPIATRAYDWGELRGAGAYVVVPPSIHPSGKPYVFRAKPDQIAQIEAWPGLPALEFLDPISSTYPRLAGRILRSDPATLAHYHSRSHTDYALIGSLINANFTPQAIATILAAATYPSHYREGIDPKDRPAWLMGAYLKAKGQGNTPAFTEARATAEHQKNWAMTAPIGAISPNKLTASSDRHALMAHLATAAKIGKREYQLSARVGAELAGMSWHTFANASKRLTALGYIKPTDRAVFGLASRWQLLDRVNTLTYRTTSVSECDNSVQIDTKGVFSHKKKRARKRTVGNVGTVDRFRPSQGLGRAAGDTWRLLIGAMMTAAELVEASGRCKKTIDRHLEKLRAVGLLAQDGDTFTAIATPEAIDRAAKQLSTAHVDGNRAARHRAERDDYRAALAKGEAGNRAIGKELTAGTPAKD